MFSYASSKLKVITKLKAIFHVVVQSWNTAYMYFSNNTTYIYSKVPLNEDIQMNINNIKVSKNVCDRIKRIKENNNAELVTREKNMHVGLYVGEKWISWLNAIDIKALKAAGVRHD